MISQSWENNKSEDEGVDVWVYSIHCWIVFIPAPAFLKNLNKKIVKIEFTWKDWKLCSFCLNFAYTRFVLQRIER